MNDKVVFLAFRNDSLIPEGRDLLACKHCHNKTFTVVYQGPEAFPMLQCPACGNHVGRIGWAADPESGSGGGGKQD